MIKNFSNKKKFLLTIFFLFFLIILFSLIDMIAIESKYVNQSTITFKVNNVRNPQIKKVVRFVDSLYGKIYFYMSTEQKNKFKVDKNKYENLPNKINIKGISKKYTKSNNLSKNNLNEWHRSHGNHSSNRFSNLKNINLTNIGDLELAWS